MMKQKIYTIGIATIITLFAGAIFKVNHYPGAAILIIAGMSVLLLVFLPLALVNHYKSSESNKNKALYIVTYITCFVVFTAMLFKLQHWPYTGVLMTIALPFPYIVFLPVFLYVASRDKSFNIYNTIFVLLLLALNSVFSGLLALNVTSNKINDSYRLSQNYNRQELVLKSLTDKAPSTLINGKIDEVLSTSEEVQKIILKYDGKSIEEWNKKAGNLEKADFKGSVANYLSDNDMKAVHELYSKMKELLVLMKSDPSYRNYSDRYGEFFQINGSEAEEQWTESVFNDFRVWTLIWIDSLQANLQAIKSSGF